ncbi:lytic transglycosylase domain-containing protein [Mycolicibacterium sp. 050158]|uniref:lytic transglycosylase domain-containing protein n=1 Tax=Mycolicibacterium sp. 050158 TaxID=3090602 RepID=UPI00299F1921|nr:lytic murein transglycosylase [Mycolicibacterium sp. 050158]MDX1892643.1 lytic murein transglycosylase [Mycolicibacterium sp. 050158]
MHMAGRSGGAKAYLAVRRQARRITGTPAFGVAVIAPLILLLAVGASAPSPRHAVADDGITPLAAVARTGDAAGVVVVAAPRPPTPFRFAIANLSAPPPPSVVSAPGGMRIPAVALSAYRNAERMMASAYPGCGVSWNLLAGIGRIESGHADGGATDAKGTSLRGVYGPALDGTLAGNEVIVSNVQAGRVTYARALGPMQFLPGTWARYASDGNGDGKADVQNVYDASLGAARYLCSGNLNLRDRSQVLTAILRYNNSMAYAQNVLGWAAAYATGVAPVDLPPIGVAPPIGDAHLDSNPEGLGPGIGLPANDPLASLALTDVSGANQLGVPPGPGAGVPPAPQQNCQVFCLTPQAPAPQQNCQVFCLTPQAARVPEAPPAPAFPPPLLPPPAPLPFGAPPADPPAPAPVAPAGPVPGPVG